MLGVLHSMQNSLKSLTHTHSAMHSARYVNKAPFTVKAKEDVSIVVSVRFSLDIIDDTSLPRHAFTKRIGML